MPDHSSLLDVSAPIAHFLEFFCTHGAPANNDAERPVSIIVNHGCALGFSPQRRQAVWGAYQVSAARRDVDYERNEFFLDDPRIPAESRIGTEPFARHAQTAYDRGHLVPNFAVNTQFGRVAQAETFFMSNIFPQRASTNQGAWQRLEMAIVRAYAPLRKQVWVIAGPIFGDDPPVIARRNGLEVPIPEAYFLIVADPERYPFEDPDNLAILAIRMPRDWGNTAVSDDLIATLPALEAATSLTFFPRLSVDGKAAVVNHTSPIMWPFDALAREPRDPRPPPG